MQREGACGAARRSMVAGDVVSCGIETILWKNIMTNALNNKTIFITGASRGIGREIALRCARDGANIVIAAKTAEPHKTLEGTIYSVAQEIIQAGGKALPLVVDVREEQ